MNNLSLKRLYIDTESLLYVFLDRSNPSPDDIAKMKNARKLWSCFKGDKIRISPYVIGEFISVGNRKYGRPVDKLVKIINEQVIPKCKVLTAKVQPDPTTAVLDSVFFNDYKKKYTVLCMRFKGEATIDNKRAGIHEVSFAVSKDLWHGDWRDYDVWTKDVVKGLSFINKPQITLSAPYFELGFFQKASDFTEKYKLPLKDAIHLVYVNREEVDIIVTTDTDFDKVKLDGIEIMPPEKVVNKYCP
jgi:predicted nucleic acid-binding protein